MKRKFIVFTGLGLFLIAGLAATRPPVAPITASPQAADPDDHKFKNLKVLPKNIDAESMDQIMETYARTVGVTCLYCHTETKPEITPKRMDFVSDENPRKEITRDMMRMMAKINKKYFSYSLKYDYTDYTKSPVSCGTCHRGFSKPIIKKPHYNNN